MSERQDGRVESSGRTERRRPVAVRTEMWKCGRVTITDFGSGVERISLPHCTVQVSQAERNGREIKHVCFGGRHYIDWGKRHEASK